MSRIPVLVAATAAASFALVGLGASPAAATCTNGADDWPTCTPTTTLPASTTTEPTETSEPSDTTSSTAQSISTTTAPATSTTTAPASTATPPPSTSTYSPTTISPPTTYSCSGICWPATVQTSTTTSLLPPVTDTLPIAPTTEPDACVLHDGTETTDYELANGPTWLGETRRNLLQCNPIVTPTTPNHPPATTGTPTDSTPGSTTPDKPELPATGTGLNIMIALAVVFLLLGVALYAVCYWLAGDVEGGEQ